MVARILGKYLIVIELVAVGTVTQRSCGAVSRRPADSELI
jgi:hypothetical protein